MQLTCREPRAYRFTSSEHSGLVRLSCILTKPPAGGDAGATAAMQLTCREPHARGPGTQFTCFTSTKVQILTHAAQCLAAHLNAAIAAQQAVWSVCKYLYLCTSKASKVSMCVAAQCLAAHLNAEIAAGNIAKVLVFANTLRLGNQLC